MDLLGAHVSSAGGIADAPDRGVRSGCEVIQVFTQHACRWLGRIPSRSEAARFQAKVTACGLHEVISHVIDLINLAAAPSETRDKSIVAFRHEMERCAVLGIDKIVMHPGAHNGDGEEVGIRRICEAFDELFATVPRFPGTILLENTAGQGTCLGYRFDHLKAIIEGTRFPERFGVCIDTCHAFAAGYDIVHAEGYQRTMEELDRTVGLSRLELIHLNDSKKGFGCRMDRHEHIGQGALGLEPFRLILNDPRLSSLPKVIETPKGESDDMDEVNLRALRSLIAPTT